MPASRARRATEDLVTELLPVLDHFEMGLKAREAALPAAVYDGLVCWSRRSSWRL